MNDNDQKRRTSAAWDSYPIGRATKSTWVVLKHGLPAGREGQDLIVDVDLAESLGLKDFGKNMSFFAQANQYVMIPAIGGESAKIRLSKELISIAANSHAGHLARIVEANMNDSYVSLDTALGIALKSDKDICARFPGVDYKIISQKIVLAGSYQMLVKALRHSSAYLEDLSAGKVIKEDIRGIRCNVGESPVVMVSTTNGGQKSYALELDAVALTVLHGEMSGMVSDSPLAPSLEFPLRKTSYSAMFLLERGEVRLSTQWIVEDTRIDDWSGKLVFK